MIRPPKPSEILNRWNTDKNTGIDNGGHNYGTMFYDHILTHYRWCSAVLEIGVLRGESLRAWAEFFPDANVVGLDINSEYLFNEGRINCFQVDCSDETHLNFFASDHQETFSVIIDDGSHKKRHQLTAFSYLKKCMKAGGIYIIEDVGPFIDYSDFIELGFKLESWNTNLRPDNRIAYYYNE